MKLKIYIYCMLFIVLLLCYCQIDVFETHSPPADLVKIRGYVTSESVLLDSVKITCNFTNDSTFTTYTDSQGYYQIKTPPGTDLTLNLYYRVEYEDVSYSFQANNDTILYTDLSPIDYYPTTVGTYWKYKYIWFHNYDDYEDLFTIEKTVTRVLNNSIEYSVHRYGTGFYSWQGDTIIVREVDETYILHESIDGDQNIKTMFFGEYINKYLHEGSYINTLYEDEQYSDKYFFQFPLERTMYTYSSKFKIECLTTEIDWNANSGIDIWIANNIGILRVKSFEPSTYGTTTIFTLLEFQPGP